MSPDRIPFKTDGTSESSVNSSSGALGASRRWDNYVFLEIFTNKATSSPYGCSMRYPRNSSAAPRGSVITRPVNSISKIDGALMHPTHQQQPLTLSLTGSVPTIHPPSSQHDTKTRSSVGFVHPSGVPAPPEFHPRTIDGGLQLWHCLRLPITIDLSLQQLMQFAFIQPTNNSPSRFT
jgi:hypothetical protein